MKYNDDIEDMKLDMSDLKKVKMIEKAYSKASNESKKGFDEMKEEYKANGDSWSKQEMNIYFLIQNTMGVHYYWYDVITQNPEEHIYMYEKSIKLEDIEAITDKDMLETFKREIKGVVFY